MDSSEDEFDSLSRRIEERERKTRRGVLVWTLVPIAVAFLFLAYTVWQIARAEANLIQANADLKQATKQLATADSNLRDLMAQISAAQSTGTAIEATQVQLKSNLSHAQSALASSTAELSRIQANLATTTAELGNARVYAMDTCNIQPEMLKNYMGNGSPAAQILLYTLQLQQEKVPWNSKGGFSIKDGFDSPRFALFVLKYAGLMSASKPDTLLWRVLPNTQVPLDGDIVHYQAGYTMFYYRDLGFEVGEDGYSFKNFDCVVGMTPLGIQVLKLKFATIIEYLSLSGAPY